MILGVGIMLRIRYQFFPPVFNKDELDLLTNLSQKGFYDLLFPLDNMQSAPPLYLWLLKALTLLLGPDWIAFKAFSLLVSCAILVYGYLMIRRASRHPSIGILFLAALAFNPYIVYHTMTVKPYGLDLLLVLLSTYHLRTLTASRWGVLLFGMWPFLSHAGLFYGSGLAAITGLRILRGIDSRKLQPTLASIDVPRIMLLLTPLPYLLYYLWFLQQPGAMELKAYMLDFWGSTFLGPGPNWPDRFENVRKLVTRDLFSSHALPAKLLPWLALAGLLLSLSQRRWRALAFPLMYLVSGAGVHLLLNMLSLYPITDRFHLHIVPLVYLGLAALPAALPALLRIPSAIGLAALLVFYFSTYLPYRENDVASLYATLQARGIDTVHCSARAYGNIQGFDRLTEGRYTNRVMLRRYPEDAGARYLVTREYHKFGHIEKSLREESFTNAMEQEGQLKLLFQVDGYNVFEVRE